MINELINFALNSSFIELSVAFVLGISFIDLIYAFIADWVTPFLSAIGGHPDFSGLFFTINNSKFMYGHFFNVLISTLIMVVITFFAIIVPLEKYKKSIKKEKEEKEEKEEMEEVKIN